MFTLFPDLPTELRLQIWQSSIPSHTPRLIKIKIADSALWANPLDAPMGTYVWPAFEATNVPSLFSLLATCGEARSVAMSSSKDYQKISFPKYPGRSPAMYIHPSTDTVYIDYDILYSAFFTFSHAFNNVRSVAIIHTLGFNLQMARLYFHGLEELIVVQEENAQETPDEFKELVMESLERIPLARPIPTVKIQSKRELEEGRSSELWTII